MSPRRSYHLSDPAAGPGTRRPRAHAIGGPAVGGPAVGGPAVGDAAVGVPTPRARAPTEEISSSKHWAGLLSETILAFGGSPHSPRKSATVVPVSSGESVSTSTVASRVANGVRPAAAQAAKASCTCAT